MRTLAIGDIHGCSIALDTLLAEVRPEPDDILVMLGDYVDRGPDSRGVLERILDLSREHRLISLRGNHEFSMLQAYREPRKLQDWLAEGGDATVGSYGLLDNVPAAHWRFIENQCIDLWETESHIFVHGRLHPDLPLNDQPTYLLYWGRFADSRPHASGKVVVCGHTRQTSGRPKNLGFAICIDTWALWPMMDVKDET